jgi:serine/threonine protein kinase/tetratricopeptide (TPR) repeat protein
MPGSGEDRRKSLSESMGTDDTDPRGNSAILEAHAEAERKKRQSSQEVASAPTMVQSGGRGGQAAFRPDDVVTGRYKIVRLVAQGGMGQVYEALDQELGERIALKTVRAEIADDPGSIERFKREIHLSRRVTHPNVCRIFDVGFHQAASGKITFLTMELLDGETLTARLRREGRMKTDDAQPLVVQMAQALAAAHQAGIIHRDFKSENVVLVPSKDHDGGVRVVVTDFGLARAAAKHDPAAHALTGAGGIVGSPGYMAPEQVEGGTVGPTADIYALGIVMYEMITGHLPFVGETPLATAVKRLKEPPPDPRQAVPDLDPVWTQTLMRCLEREPADRFANALEVARSLGGEVVSAPISLSRAFRRRRRSMTLVASSAVLVSAIALGLVWRLHRQRGTTQVTSGSARRALAVLGFKNLAGKTESAWLGPALSELLSAELGTGGGLRIIPEENVTRMRSDLSLGDADSLAPDTLEKVRRQLGSDLVVSGAYLLVGNKLRVDLRLVDASSGETLAQATESGADSDLLDLVSRAGTALRSRLGMAAPTQQEETATHAMMPTSMEATRLYSEGVTHLRRHEPIAARTQLEQAVALEPNFALAHSALSAVYHGLGYDQRSLEESKRAMELSQGLPVQDRLNIEGHYYDASKQWAKAMEAYRKLWDSAPDNIQYVMFLAASQIHGGKAKDALSTVDAARKLHPTGTDDARLELVEAKANESLGDVKAQLAAAARAAEKARTLGSRQIEADSYIHEGNARWAMGELDGAVAAYERAKSIYVASGQRVGLTMALTNLAGIKYNRGDLAGAREGTEQALEILRDLGDRENIALNEHNLANMVGDQGDYKEATRLYEEAIKLRREIDDKGGLISSLATSGGLLAEEGDLAGAKKRVEEALSLARQIHRRNGVAYSLMLLGDLSQTQGEDNVARGRWEEALATWNELGDKVSAAETRVLLATLAIAQHHPAEAEAPVREAITFFHSEKAVDNEAKARAVLAESLAAQKKTAEAKRAIVEADSSLAESKSREVHLSTDTILARAQALAGDSAGAQKRLAQVIDESKKKGLVRFELEARLALGRAQGSAGKPMLAALAKEAGSRGFKQLAREAQGK